MPPNNTTKTSISVNCLLPELLSDIFWLVIRGDSAFGRIRNTASRTLTLCSVCSRWRSLIISHSSLWSCIPVGNDERSYHFTRLCLERSKDSLVDIVAYVPHRWITQLWWPSNGPRRSGDWEGKQELLMHASRIRSVFVAGDTRERIQSLLDCIVGERVPKSLAELSIMLTDLSTEFGRVPYLAHRDKSAQENLIRLTDQLHTLHLSGVFPSYIWEEWKRCSFSQLRELVLDTSYMYSEETSHIMTTSSNLRSLEFCGRGRSVADQSSLQPLFNPRQGTKILRLHKLSFEHLRRGMEWATPGEWETEVLILMSDYQPLCALPNYSTVMALSLVDDRRPIQYGGYIREILEELPNLQILTLQSFVLSKSILDSLTRPLGQVEGKQAQLSVLRLHSVQVSNYTAFESMIASHPIRRLEIWNSELEWGGKERYKPATKSYQPSASSPLYLRLRKQVPEVYIVAPRMDKGI